MSEALLAKRQNRRRSWLAALQPDDPVFIKGWGGAALGIGTVVAVNGSIHDPRAIATITVKYPNRNATFRFCRREGVGLDLDNFDLLEPAGDPDLAAQVTTH